MNPDSSVAVGRRHLPTLRVGRMRKRTRELALIVCFLLPSLAIFFLYRLLPLGWNAWLSLHAWSPLKAAQFIGLEHYEEMLLDDDVFWQALVNTLVFIAPYFPVPDLTNVCTDFQGCYDQCRTTAFPQTGCMLQCTGDLDCAQCVLGGVIGCTSDSCGPQADAMLQCFQSCDSDMCIGQMCTNQILAFDQCSSPIVEAGTCDNSVVACNVNL